MQGFSRYRFLEEGFVLCYLRSHQAKIKGKTQIFSQWRFLVVFLMDIYILGFLLGGDFLGFLLGGDFLGFLLGGHFLGFFSVDIF
jgi:hypothetical protein